MRHFINKVFLLQNYKLCLLEEADTSMWFLGDKEGSNKGTKHEE